MDWGIAGTGKIAHKFLDTIEKMEGERIVAVGSRRKESAEAFISPRKGLAAHGNYSDLFRDQRVEAVYIAVPNTLHYALIKEALENGKHVLSEKPMTLSPLEMSELYRMAEERGVMLMEGYWVWFLPMAEKLRKIKERIGRIEKITLTYGFVSEGERRRRKLSPSLGGGAIYDIGIYNLGIPEMLGLTEPVVMESKVRRNELGSDEYSFTVLRYKEGAVVETTNAIGEDIPRVCTIQGEKGAINIPDFQNLTSFTLETGSTHEEFSSPFLINGFEYEIESFSEEAKKGRTHSSLFTPGHSINISTIIDNIVSYWRREGL